MRVLQCNNYCAPNNRENQSFNFSPSQHIGATNSEAATLNYHAFLAILKMMRYVFLFHHYKAFGVRI